MNMTKVFIVAFLTALIWNGFFIFFAGGCGNFWVGCIAYVVPSPFVIPLIFAFASGHFASIKGRPFAVLFWSFVAAVLAMGIVFIIRLPIAQKEIDASRVESDKQEEEFQNQRYPIRILDSTETTVLNDTIVTIKSPYTIHINILESAIPPDRVITAGLIQDGGGSSVTIRLQPTGKVLNGRHYYQGVAQLNLFTNSATGETIRQGLLFVNGAPDRAYESVHVIFE